MLKIALFYICAAFLTVTPHPLLRRCQRQCQYPVNNLQQNQHVNVAVDPPHQHNMVPTPQLVNQGYNAFVKNPHQCIPVRDQENQQFLNRILENPLIKALQGQNRQQYQSPVQNTPHPHVVNNYFIIPTEALLNEDDEKASKSKGKHDKKDEKHSKTNGINETRLNDNKVFKTSYDGLNDDTHIFLDEYFNRDPHPRTSGSNVQKNMTPSKCSKNEQHIEVELQPTFAKIQEHHEQENVKVLMNLEVEEAVIQDLRNKFPNMPEPLLRSLISEIRQKLQRFHLPSGNRHPQGLRSVTRRHGNSTIDVADNQWQRRPGHRRPLRRNANRKRKGCYTNTTMVGDVEGTSKKIEKLDLGKAVPVEPPVTEFHRNDETTTENPKHTASQEIDKSNEVESTTPYVIYTNHRNIILPELGFEDIIPNVDNGINDDYYPDFRKDNKAYAINDAIFNHPEFYDEVLRSERKVHNAEIHRSKILDGKKVPKKVMRNLLERQSKRNSAERRHDDRSEEIIYRTPPGLESPDFKTVNVREYHSRGYERPTYFSHEYANSADGAENEVRSFNKEPIITYYLPSKPSNAKQKRPEEKVETVFANSKIVNYGHSLDAFNGETTTIANMYLDHDSLGTAKTIVESEEFGW